jgi:hypothetical protein
MNKNIPFFGYLLVSLVYGYYLYKNISSNKNNEIFNNTLILLGYVFLTYKQYKNLNSSNTKIETNKKTDESNKKTDESKEKESEINYGNLILFIYFSLLLITPNSEFQYYKYFALFGNLLLIKNTKFNKLGYIAIIIFHLISAQQNFLNNELNRPDIQIKLAGVSLILYYTFTELIS